MKEWDNSKLTFVLFGVFKSVIAKIDKATC
jgi:hypothetical protein